MASSRDSSNRPDAVDVRYVLQAFEEINRVFIEIRLTLGMEAGEPVLQVGLWAHRNKESVGVAPSLASVKSTVGFRKHPSLDTAILQGLYKLDAELGLREFARTDTK